MLAAEQVETEEIETKKKHTAEEYFALPENAHTELIDGEFFPLFDMGSPSFNHQTLLGEIYFSISSHIKTHKGSCRVMPAPFMVKLNKEKDNYVEPDISVICDSDKLTEKGCIGAPDWIIEITSPSNPRHDYIRKLQLYTDAGVKEYWMVDPTRHTILTVYTPDENIFAPMTYTFEDKVPSNTFKDLVIDFSEISKLLK